MVVINLFIVIIFIFTFFGTFGLALFVVLIGFVNNVRNGFDLFLSMMDCLDVNTISENTVWMYEQKQINLNEQKVILLCYQV